MSKTKDKNPNTYRKAQAKYMINLTFTTEKHAKIIAPRKPTMLKPKNKP